MEQPIIASILSTLAVDVANPAIQSIQMIRDPSAVIIPNTIMASVALIQSVYKQKS